MSARRCALLGATLLLATLVGCLAEEEEVLPPSGPIVEGAQVPGYSEDIHRFCGTPELTAGEMEDVEAEAYERLADLGIDVDGGDLRQPEVGPGIDPNLGGKKLAPFVPFYNIPIYFHIIEDSDGNGAITPSQIADQISVMNAAFAGTGTTFTLAVTTTTVNSTWYTGCATTAESAMKTALRGSSGSWKDLHVYSCAPSGGLIGRATWPWSRNKTRDGVLIHHGTVPGGSIGHYNLGDTLVHEVGHWLGVYHTFQGGCTGGDAVADTPAEGSSAGGCPTGRDTCTGSAYPGPDPITNFMDYTYDSCMGEFTAGQGARMDLQYNAGRYPY